jgi:hypothetical protein
MAPYALHRPLRWTTDSRSRCSGKLLKLSAQRNDSRRSVRQPSSAARCDHSSVSYSDVLTPRGQSFDELLALTRERFPICGGGTMGFYKERILPWLVHLSMRQRRLAPYRNRVVSSATGRVSRDRTSLPRCPFCGTPRRPAFRSPPAGARMQSAVQ